jgi:hypothetical protein
MVKQIRGQHEGWPKEIYGETDQRTTLGLAKTKYVAKQIRGQH